MAPAGALLLKSWILLLLLCSPLLGYKIRIDDAQALAIGKRIYQNECGSKKENLIFWNTREPFPSLGIGHFLWLPQTATPATFEAVFPQFLNFLIQKNILLPPWLATQVGAPWQKKEDLEKNRKSIEVLQLQELLESTFAQQTEFIILRLQNQLPAIIKSAKLEKQKLVKRQIELLCKSPEGIFALIDYLNFKGSGLSLQERYQGEGWGLLQILEGMPANTNKRTVVAAFVRVAKVKLRHRVAHAPNDEKHWLPGWEKRLDLYLQEFEK